MAADDKELALAFDRGEKGAYQAIYDRYSSRVERLCRRMLGDLHDAQEAGQETFLRVYQALPRFNGRYQLGAWITRIATNVCLDQLRSRKRCPEDASPLEEVDLDVSEAPTADEPEIFLIRRAESRHVRRTLNSLPPMHRAAIILRDFEGLSYEDISVALSITESQTKALLHRARKNFKRLWSPLDAAHLFIPWRVVQRLRKPDVLGDDVGQVARTSGSFAEGATSFAHAVSTCSAALQQCGQFVGERMTALATTVLVGTAAMGGVAVGRAGAPSEHRPPAKIVSVEPAVRAQTEPPKPKIHPKPETPPEDVVASPLSSPSPAGAAPTPAAPSPSASPSPAPSPSPASSPTDRERSSGSPKPVEAKPTTVALGFDRGQPIPAAPPQSNETFVHCAAKSVHQSLSAPLWDGDVSYAAQLALDVSESSASLNLSIAKDGREYTFNGGSSSVQMSSSGNSMEIAFAGSYSWNGGPRPSSGNLSDHGRFDALLSLDCAAGRVVTESLTFTT